MKKVLALMALTISLAACSTSPPSEAPASTSALSTLPSSIPPVVTPVPNLEHPLFAALTAKKFHKTRGGEQQQWTRIEEGGKGYAVVDTKMNGTDPVLVAVGFKPMEGVRAIVTDDLNVSWNIFFCEHNLSTATMDKAVIEARLDMHFTSMYAEMVKIEQDHSVKVTRNGQYARFVNYSCSIQTVG